ncbi:peptide chain release factor N(5)-glutamine methyltransferase [Gaetbulibacter aquiaggeris]|uniref:peptide chain release factor N(5)-glutamine methyltransferase n=1 Tax=Gaetbulibacter aquiaggeris TaxID=1735373 RepID=A0ABW7MTP9_9FLAO
MKLKELKELFKKELGGLYDVEEIDSFFYILIERYLGLKRIALALKPELSCSEEDMEPIFKAFEDLKREIPIQYILGETEFFGLPFKVNSNVLIPRPETEELVDWILNTQKTLSNNNKLHVLDIGTGSGCIAISLAKNINHAHVYALDVSHEALEAAKKNATLNHVSIEFIEANILKPETWNTAFKDLKFDIIVSNPPYVRALEKAQMKSNVVNNEPHVALFVENEDPLIFYRAITKYAVDNLTDKGYLFFEINEYLGKPMTQLLKSFNFNAIELKQDIFKKDRMIKGITNK